MSDPAGTVRQRVRAYVHADPKTMARHRMTLFLLTGAALSVGALVGVAWVAGFQACWDALRLVRRGWLALAPVLLVVTHLGYTVAYRQVAQVAGW